MEATVADSIVCPVSMFKIALSEARNIEPLSTTLICVALAAWFAFRGAEADGLDVVRVSFTLLSEAALVLSVTKNPNKRINNKLQIILFVIFLTRISILYYDIIIFMI